MSEVSVPGTTTVERDGNTIVWHNETFDVSVGEAEAIDRAVRQRASEDGVEAVLVDNSAASGAWDPEINELWKELMEWFAAAGLRSATVCPSSVNAMQINQLARQTGTEETIRAFEESEAAAARELVGLNG